MRIVQIGALLVVLVATLHRTYELDRFLLPKELVLHVVAFLAALSALRLLRRVAFTRVDLLLMLYLVVSAVSAALATNEWLGFRALAVSASAVLLFEVARALRLAGHARAVLRGVAVAVGAAAITALLQTYGAEIELFARNRAPGGTLGNRNFIGHAAAFGLPVLLLSSLYARTLLGHLAGAAGVAVVSAALVLTRSRAAWVATAAVLVVYAAALLFLRQLRGDGRTWRRSLATAAIAAGGIAAALLVPNTLRWRSDNPYLDSVRGVAAYDEGSGRGRLIQYERSMRMTLTSPLVGVGPGNWPVEYPDHAARRDPSLDPSEPGTTYNPWPSSDWVAVLCERGFAGALLLVLAFASLALGGWRQARLAADRDDALVAVTLVATIAGASVAGAFDAVLLLGAPALLVWTAAGALWHPAPPPADDAVPAPRPFPATVALLLLVVSLAGALRSGAQVIAMELHSRNDLEALRVAATVDPANYRVRIRLAGSGSRRERCGHARAAVRLFPHAGAARSRAEGCGD